MIGVVGRAEPHHQSEDGESGPEEPPGGEVGLLLGASRLDDGEKAGVETSRGEEEVWKPRRGLDLAEETHEPGGRVRRQEGRHAGVVRHPAGFGRPKRQCPMEQQPRGFEGVGPVAIEAFGEELRHQQGEEDEGPQQGGREGVERQSRPIGNPTGPIGGPGGGTGGHAPDGDPEGGSQQWAAERDLRHLDHDAHDHRADQETLEEPLGRVGRGAETKHEHQPWRQDEHQARHDHDPQPDDLQPSWKKPAGRGEVPSRPGDGPRIDDRREGDCGDRREPAEDDPPAIRHRTPIADG